MHRLPVSLQSLLIQCAAFVLAALLFWGLARVVDIAVPLPGFVLVQGGLAAALSRRLGQPAWWWVLHPAFLPAAWLALHLALPPWAYLAAFVLLLLFFWSSFRTRVPLYLSDRKAWQALIPLLPAGRPFRFIDLGSGLGDVLFYLEPCFPLGRFEGTEIAPAPWLISRLRAAWRGSGAIFLRRDYATLDLGDYDVVFAFLSPAAMPALWAQAQAQMRAGTWFVSLSFKVAGPPPERTIALADGARHTLFAWHMPATK
ncbi:MAG: class I SAM-dependent methyltransferase [Thiobacillus sp.]|nr:class I SAM-dependent methyltransferase [Thiobacillus sp.]